MASIAYCLQCHQPVLEASTAIAVFNTAFTKYFAVHRTCFHCQECKQVLNFEQAAIGPFTDRLVCREDFIREINKHQQSEGFVLETKPPDLLTNGVAPEDPEDKLDDEEGEIVHYLDEEQLAQLQENGYQVSVLQGTPDGGQTYRVVTSGNSELSAQFDNFAFEDSENKPTSGKECPKPTYFNYEPEQENVLRLWFNKFQYPDDSIMAMLAQQTGLSSDAVSTWFESLKMKTEQPLHVRV